MEDNGQQNLTSTDDTGQGGGEAKWYDSITDESLKGNDAIKGLDGIESLAKSFITVQGENATLKEQIEASKPIVPDKPEGYELPDKFEGMPDEITATLSKSLAKVAMEAGLSKDQANKAFSALMAQEVQDLKDHAAAYEKQVGEVKAGLQKEFGDKYAEVMNGALLRCNQIAEKAGINGDDFKAFINKGIGDDPTFIRFAIALSNLLSPDNFERNESASTESSRAQRMYPSMKK